MSIDPFDLKSSEDLTKYLGIQNLVEQTIDINNCLSQVWYSAQEIWSDIDLDNYTNHDVLGHSINIIKYFIDFSYLFDWSIYEKLIFSTAAIIHDIGMQYNKWAPKLKKFPKAPLASQEIREKHCFLGRLLIMEQLEDSYKLKYPSLFFHTESEAEKTMIYRASLIAFSHSGRKLVEEFENDKDDLLRMTKLGNSIYRPRLLAIILRICDELDCNYERIKKNNKIDTWYMDDVSKSHWLCCFFIEKVDLEKRSDSEKKEIGIKIRWRTPRSSTEFQKDLIKDFVEKIRISHIANEIAFGDNFLTKKREMLLNNIRG